MRLIFVLLFSFFTLESSANDPVILFTNSFLGPQFILYSDSTIIYLKNYEGYRMVKLNNREYSKLMKQFNLEYLLTIKDRSIQGVERIKCNSLYIWNNGTMEPIAICVPAHIRYISANSKNRHIKKVFTKLNKYSNKNTIEWIPDSIEIELEHSSFGNEYFDWKNEWFDFSLNKTIVQGLERGQIYSFTIHKKYWSDFKRYFNSDFNSNYLFTFRNMTLKPTFHLHFPGEDKWKNP